MKTIIFYYTGTGNSLWVARKLADELEEAELLSISDMKDGIERTDSEIVGLVFPVHIWGVPAPIIRLVHKLKRLRADYFFAIAVNAGQVANTLVQLKGIMAKKSLPLSAGFEIPMPSNYIPWGGPGPKEKQRKQFGLAREKISKIAVSIKGKLNIPVEKGPLWQRVLFTGIYKMTFSQVPKMDRQFWVDEKCNHCKICRMVCPSANITMGEGKPVWNHRCEQCFSCLQWCPQEAVQYGKRTPRYERYHHPEVLLNDVLRNMGDVGSKTT